ncbi:MAG: type II secretion system protein [Kiritimatiellia bacterium]
MRNVNGRTRGFTLIELLVVITIIGLLMAIIVPSIRGALEGAKKARAMSQIDALDGAIKRYFAEYGRMPVPAGGNGQPDKLFTGADQAQVVEILINAENLDDELNPREIVFLDVDPASFQVKTVQEMQSALQGGTPYEDPWKDPDNLGKHAYGLMMDLNFDEKIDDVGYGEIRAKSAVYSGGPHGDTAAPPYKTW